MKKKAIDALIEMGMPAGNRGFAYIVDAMCFMHDDNYYLNGKLIALYEKIAQKNNSSWVNVERAIRHSFKVMLERGDLGKVNKYLTFQRPTNGNLLRTLYFRLAQEE